MALQLIMYVIEKPDAHSGTHAHPCTRIRTHTHTPIRPKKQQELLPGTWQLLYTTAPDVVPLLAPSPGLPLLPQVGPIYQKFTKLDEQGIGRVENVIKLSIPGLLVPGNGGMCLGVIMCVLHYEDDHMDKAKMITTTTTMCATSASPCVHAQ